MHNALVAKNIQVQSHDLFTIRTMDWALVTGPTAQTMPLTTDASENLAQVA